MRRVCLFYCLSGFVSLGYQVVWFRTYVDQFGSTNLTFVLVLCNFIGGLGAGSLTSQRVTKRLATWLHTDDWLRLYGVVELLVVATICLSAATRFIPADAWGTFPYALRGGIYSQTLLYQLSKVGIAILGIFVACFFMGVTFPQLCYAFRNDRRFPSLLYAWNTLGACSGVLACQFLFLPQAGHDRTLWVLVALNALIGVYFALAGGAPDTAAAVAATPDLPAPPARSRAGKRRSTGQPPRGTVVVESLGVLLTCAILSGLLAGALEGDLFKRINFLRDSSSATMAFISFWAILAIFLGSWIVRAVPRIGLFHIKIATLVAVLVYGATWYQAYSIQDWFTARVVADISASHPAALPAARGMPAFQLIGLGNLLLLVGIFVFPAYLGISLLFPYVCNQLQTDRRHLGVAYGANTLAFCIGLVAFTWIAPRVNIFYSMKLLMVLLTVGVVLLWLLPLRGPLSAWKPAAATGAFLAGCLLTPATFDARYMKPGSWPAKYPIRAMKSNGAHTTFVVQHPRFNVLYFENLAMSGTNARARTYMRLMAHFPLLAHPQPQSALLICFGVGNTALAIAEHDTIERLDIVELNDKVIETAAEFSATNEGVYLDARIRFIHDDGRNYLNIADARYDLITSEPPPPMLAGVDRLYSREYYQQVLAHLTPAGMMTQWLPTYQMPREAVDLAVSTFVGVFPHTLLFTGHDTEYILLGSRSPIDLSNIEKRFDTQPRATADLRRLGLNQPIALVARVIQGDATLRGHYAGRPVISDQRNDLAHLVLDPRRPAVITYDPEAVLADIGANRLAMGGTLPGVLTHLGRLRYRVADFPIDTVQVIQRGNAERVRLADLDWRQAVTLETKYAEARAAQRVDEAGALLRQLLALSGEQPGFLLELARYYRFVRQPQTAVTYLQKFVEMEPEEPVGYLTLGHELVGLQQFRRAIPVLQRGLQLAPRDGLGHRNLGIALQSEGKWDAAIRHFRQAVALNPDDAQARDELRRAQQRQGNKPGAPPPPL